MPIAIFIRSVDHASGKSELDLSPVGAKIPCERLQLVMAEIDLAEVRHLLEERKCLLARQVLKATQADIGRECRDYGSSLVQAWLHYYMGVAIAQQLEEGAEQESVWFESVESQQCVEEFMLSYQLCFPVMPTILLRETCLWLALLLTHPDHAHHFLGLYMHISLVHETVLPIGKKMR